MESSDQTIDEKILRTQGNLGKRIDQTSQTLERNIDENKQGLLRGINQVKEIASGAPLIVLDNPRKYTIMQARLQAFGACARGDNGESR